MVANFNKWQIKPSDRARQYMLLNGVPAGLINAFTLQIDKIVAPLDIGTNKSRIITTKQQTEWFSGMRTKMPLRPFIMLLTSEQRFFIARQAALLLFWNYLLNSINFPNTFNHSRPTWHLPSIDFHNSLLEEYNEGKHRVANLMVIDSLTTNMPNGKATKIHDLLQTICDRPYILLLHGKDTYKYCVEILGVRPNYLINIEHSVDRNIV